MSQSTNIPQNQAGGNRPQILSSASHKQSRYAVNRMAKIAMIVCASSSFLILLVIIAFIFREGLPAFIEVGFFQFLFGIDWSPSRGMFGILPMIAGSLAVTIGSIAVAIPLGVACAILLAEIAPFKVREALRPAVELLVGIPSVIYGLVGMLVIVPAVRQIGGTGYSVLAACVVLIVMILPTIISISEDSIRAVPRKYKEGSLSLGATQWQTVWHVLIPAARSGIGASIVLGIGRAIGETMAMIMVIGNAVMVPTSPLSPARTLTGNIAVEINYATGLHANALFATAIILLAFIVILNSITMALFKRGFRGQSES
ncbi:MAG TPA: phosphate ABC transporter permease subunit PstC [Dehalococcoidales bacterium]|nr:phosphate ABC transporter permease subunit PstC [Dehalococcoidales bacterium]